MTEKAKTSPEFDRFNALVGKVLSVPKAVLKQRLEEHEKQSKLNPKRRGPKPKAEHDEGHS
jgi:hypothetical protein